MKSRTLLTGLSLSLLCHPLLCLAKDPALSLLNKPASQTEAPAPEAPVKELLLEADANANKAMIVEDHSIIQKYAANFTFDWNQYESIPANKKQLAEIENGLVKIQKFSNLTSAEQQSLGKLLYKLGTYYTHVSREPDLAIQRLNLAESMVKDKETLAWIDNHLAYAYEEKYATDREAADREKALSYSNKVINTLYPNQKNKVVAFAYCVKALTEDEAQDYSAAETSFKTALNIYDTLPNGKDDQYARSQNRLADIILNQDGRDQEAIALLKQLQTYWQGKGDISHNPYAARNLLSLGRAYLKIGDTTAAQNSFKSALDIYTNVYGAKSKMLSLPYQQLSLAYARAGQQKLAQAYKREVSKLQQS
jgi:tetratricopeptide (TPR) repeat protein